MDASIFPATAKSSIHCKIWIAISASFSDQNKLADLFAGRFALPGVFRCGHPYVSGAANA